MKQVECSENELDFLCKKLIEIHSHIKLVSYRYLAALVMSQRRRLHETLLYINSNASLNFPNVIQSYLR